MDERLPTAVSSAPEIVQMWTQVSILQSLLNDMLSLKKELRTDCVINAVAAIMEPGMTLDMVISELEERMRLAVKQFDEAADKLLKKTEFRKEIRPIVERYANGYRSIVTGMLKFTLTSPRYDISKLIQEDVCSLDRIQSGPV
ncbi:hypothetical protein F53441_11159 [Fusarium austroafricanum]|uniref:Uncharacterized protein n=1 Tax=Fusarium austroafricanum TaxID=2364996 RepID=A0A8H4P0N6_9HYPO|nr:hypothetical protein F53441_11159 [Fusarium austroafricanum]